MKASAKINAVFSWFGLINHPSRENASKGDFEAFNDILNKSYRFSFLYATAIHDKDFHEDGTPKAIHMHLFLNTRDNPYTKEQLIEKLSKDFGIGAECISMEPAVDVYRCVRYLTHKGTPWKHQYNPTIITTNSPEEIRQFYLTDFEVLQQSNTLEELAKLRGATFVKTFLTTYKEVKKEQGRDLEATITYLGRLENLFDKLKTLVLAIENDKLNLMDFVHRVSQLVEVEDKLELNHYNRAKEDYLLK